MPQEFDAQTGNAITQENARADPVAPALHRSAVAAPDGTSKPGAGDVRWLANPGYHARARVFVTSTGTPTTCTVRTYLRSGGAVGQVATGALQTLGGPPSYDLAYDVQLDGDDVLCLIETLAGGTGPAVSIFVSWR